VQLPAPVDPGSITAAQISQLQEVTKENLSDTQMRALLAKSGGHVNIAVELYFNTFDAAQNDLRKRGLPVHTDRSPQRKRLSAEEQKEVEATYARVVNGEDDDIEIVGTKTDVALVAMPHARCSCPVAPTFVVLPPEQEASERVRKANSKTCPKCYCYVCDVLASECTEWTSHCMAFDRDQTWKKRRAQKKQKTTAAAPAAAAAGAAAGGTPAAQRAGSSSTSTSASVSGGGTGGAAATAQARKPPPLCNVPGWTVNWSSDHNEWFYWNQQTQVSQWVAPTA